MICKRVSTEFAQFIEGESLNDLKDLVLKNCRENGEGPAHDYDPLTG